MRNDEETRALLLRRSFLAPSGCRLWTGAKNAAGYGNMLFRGRNVGTHRVAFEVFTGASPLGMYVCHRCDQPSCIEPGHLFSGTAADNSRDMFDKQRFKPNIRIPESDVQAIRGARRAGESLKSIANRFGVSEASVSLIARRLSRA